MNLSDSFLALWKSLLGCLTDDFSGRPAFVICRKKHSAAWKNKQISSVWSPITSNWSSTASRRRLINCLRFHAKLGSLHCGYLTADAISNLHLADSARLPFCSLPCLCCLNLLSMKLAFVGKASYMIQFCNLLWQCSAPQQLHTRPLIRHSVKTALSIIAKWSWMAADKSRQL